MSGTEKVSSLLWSGQSWQTLCCLYHTFPRLPFSVPTHYHRYMYPAFLNFLKRSMEFGIISMESQKKSGYYLTLKGWSFLYIPFKDLTKLCILMNY